MENHAGAGRDRGPPGRWFPTAPWRIARWLDRRRKARFTTLPTGPATGRRFFDFRGRGRNGALACKGSDRAMKVTLMRPASVLLLPKDPKISGSGSGSRGRRRMAHRHARGVIGRLR